MRTLFFLLALSTTTMAQSPMLGKWTTIDDNTGEPRSMVEITVRGSKVFGKIIKLYPKEKEDPDPLCDKCPEDDDRYGMKVIGMEIIRDMKWSEKELTAGSILDPETGRVYGCKIWIEGDDLKVRGYWGPFYRTQTWKKVH